MVAWRQVLVVACLIVAGCAGVQASSGDSQVLFIAHDVTADTSQARAQRFLMYADVTTDRTARTRIDPIWLQGRGAHSRGSLSLSPGNDGDRGVIEILERGFVLASPDPDTGPSLKPADPQAWQAQGANANDPLLAHLRLQALGLRPVELPATLTPGQRIMRRERGGDFNALDTRMHVRALTPDLVLLELEFEGDGLSGHGRQALRRADGRPLETRLYLTTGADTVLPGTHRLYMVDMATHPVIDLEYTASQPEGLFDVTTERLAAPPFSARSDDPALFAKDPMAEGALEAWMTPDDDADSDLLLSFGVLPHHDGGRPHIALRADRSPQTQPNGPLFLRLRDAQLLDDAGKPLPGADAVITQPTLALYDSLRLEETQVAFPFRLPLALPTPTLQSLANIRMLADARVYRWDQGETVRHRAQGAHNADARLTWASPYRVTLQQTTPAYDGTTGTWTTAVPIDADGHEIASAQIFVSRHHGGPGDWCTLAGMPRLQLDPENASERIEIATHAPMAGLRLRHYAWRNAPRVLMFEDIRTQMDNAERAIYERELAGEADSP